MKRRKNPRPIARDMAEPNPNAHRRQRAPSAQASYWSSTGSTVGTHHEITSCQTFNRRRRSQDQRQSRRGLLERDEGNIRNPEPDLVGTGGRDRRQSPAG